MRGGGGTLQWWKQFGTLGGWWSPLALLCSSGRSIVILFSEGWERRPLTETATVVDGGGGGGSDSSGRNWKRLERVLVSGQFGPFNDSREKRVLGRAKTNSPEVTERVVKKKGGPSTVECMARVGCGGVGCLCGVLLLQLLCFCRSWGGREEEAQEEARPARNYLRWLRRYTYWYVHCVARSASLGSRAIVPAG